MSANPAPGLQPRVIRVFVSSTFLDMQEEREELVKRVFPQLRKLCENRGVVWGEVDLRWGVTDEQKAEGKVLPICLAEIQRCRPYFIGLLGDRYGWVPDEIPQELIEQEPWLKEHLSHSVTELEILHGVLNNPKMADHAFFYFRDPAYIESLPPDKRESYLSENPESAEKLRQLKEHIRTSSLPLHERYTNPQVLGELVLADLKSVIDRLYPEGSQLDALDRDAADHEAFAQSRAQVYIGRQEYFDRLDEHVVGDGPPLVVLGESGCGKSALLANWALQYHQKHPEEFVFMHFIGATPYSADWAAMVRRIMGELKRRFDIQGDIPDKPEELRLAFANCLHMAAAKGRMVIILDALNQLDDREGAPDLVWLPPVIPANVRLLLSTLPGRPLGDLVKRGWPTQTVEPLRSEERKKFISEYLGQYTKSLESTRAERIAAAPQTANPLFLKALLEELRVFGIHEQLDERIDHYLSAQTIPELYEKILARYEEDYERDRPGLVKDAMTFIWAARRGLSETELLEMLGSSDNPLPRAFWSPLYLAAEQSLVNRSGLVGYYHDYFRQAVEQHYLPTIASQREAHTQLAEYFDLQNLGPRKLEELAWQLMKAEEWGMLEEWITYEQVFELMYAHDRYELLGYWLALGNRYSLVESYLTRLEAWEKQTGNPLEFSITLELLAHFFQIAGHYNAAEPLFRKVIEIREQLLGGGDQHTAAAVNSLALLLKTQRRLAEAESLYRKALATFEKVCGPESLETAKVLGNLGILVEIKGDLIGAEPLLRRSLEITQKNLGLQNPTTARAMSVLAGLLRTQGEYLAAEKMYRRAVAIMEHSWGPEHPETLACQNNLGQTLISLGDLENAEAMLLKVLSVREKVLGSEHPDVAVTLSNLVVKLQKKEDFTTAEIYSRRALQIWERAVGVNHPNTALGMNNLASVLSEKGQIPEAEKLYRDGIAILEKIYNSGHPDLAVCMSNLADLLEKKGDTQGAQDLQQRAQAIREKMLGIDHPDIARILEKQGHALYENGDLAGAEKLCRQVVEIREKTLGAMHPDAIGALQNLAQVFWKKLDAVNAEPLCKRVIHAYESNHQLETAQGAMALNMLGEISMMKGDSENGEALIRRALEIRERTLGPDHADITASLNNLAMLLKVKGNLQEAATLLKRSVRILARDEGLYCYNTTIIAWLLFNILAEARDDAATSVLQEYILPLFEREPQTLHQAQRKILQQVIDIYRTNKQV